MKRRDGGPVSGNRVTRMAALAAVCFAAVITAAAQAQQESVSITVHDCTTESQAFTARCFSVSTRPAAAIRLNIGVVPISDGIRVTHTVTVPGLTAGTTYVGSLVAMPKQGKPKTIPLSPFQTAAPGSAPATASVSGNRLLVNGQPTLLFAAYIAGCWDEATINTDRSVGFNTIVGHACVDASSPQTTIANLQSALGNTWWREQEKAREGQLQGMKSLLTWNAQGPAPVFPALDPCKGSESKLVEWFSSTMSQISQASSSKVVIPTIWAAKTLMNGTPNCLTAQWLDLFFWGSLAKGARGFVADTHQPISPVDVPNFSVDPRLWDQLGTELKWASAFGPIAIGGKRASFQVSTTEQVVSNIWSYGGGWYVVLVNPTLTSATAVARPPKTAALLATGMFGTSSVKLQSGQLKVQMAPKSYAVYKILTK